MSEKRLRDAIAVDFDGTLCELAPYPGIGAPKIAVIEAAKARQKKGAGLILWTCREGSALDAAIAWCEAYGLHFDAVNNNLPEWKAYYGNDTRKVGATEYWDDRSFTPDRIKPIRRVESIADVDPVVHGYWYFSEYEFFSCSVCGFSYYNGCNSTKEAKDRLKNKDDIYAYCPHCGARMDGDETAIDIIRRQPTADVVSVIHAHWIVRSKRRKYEESDGTVVYTDCGCSACKRWGYTNMSFCPWCQAVMDQPMEVT